MIDVAKAHYEAIARGASSRYLFIGGDNDNVEIAKILREEFPEQAHRIPTNGTPVPPHWSFDSSPSVPACDLLHALQHFADFHTNLFLSLDSAERELGITYTSLRETIKAAGAQLFALEAELGKKP